jgi:P4 family phage/plasmid primase-like protien
MRGISVSLGGRAKARIRKTWTGSFEAFCHLLTRRVPETMDKGAAGWVCGATFDNAYRDTENFIARHLLSFDYDHVTKEEAARLLDHYAQVSSLAHTTWSHGYGSPRLRVWLPLSRPCGYDEFQAVSRAVAAKAGIEKAARESHVPCQFMYRPAIKPFEEFQSWQNIDGPWVQFDEVLKSYENWTDRSRWPKRPDEKLHSNEKGVSPLEKPGLIGAWNRVFPISAAIARFELPYEPGSDGRYTYTQGSVPNGAIIYDNDTKLHSHHDTDPARGQSSSYDLVRIHLYGWADRESDPVGRRDSTFSMDRLGRSIPEIRRELCAAEGFEDLDDPSRDTSWAASDGDLVSALAAGNSQNLGTQRPALPARISRASTQFSDLSNARLIQRKYGDKLISVAGTFYCFKGTHWARDEDKAASSRYIAALNQLVAQRANAIEEKDEEKSKALIAWAHQCSNNSTMESCERILRKQLAMPATMLNRSNDLFVCANGTIDLRTGDLGPHEPLDLITLCAPTVYDPGAGAPRFKQFLTEIFTPDFIDFVQRWLGYCITGHVIEHKMVFHVGLPRSGKGTLMRLLGHVLGPYYSTSASKLLNLDQSGATPDMARLMGQRMVTISETDDGVALKNDVVKLLTGGDPINARFLRENPIEFLPTHKLQLFTNHHPQVKGADEGTWSRIYVVDYPYTFGDAAAVASGAANRLKDLHLDPKLHAEARGVLAWLVEGAKEWYRQGLNAPDCVKAATERERQEQDKVLQFAKECLVKDDSARLALSAVQLAIFPIYKSWCDRNNCGKLGRSRFAREILRVVPGTKMITWREGEFNVEGFSGIRLAEGVIL